MLGIDKSRLNEHERKMHDLVAVEAANRRMSIGEAADLCGCSVSKVSKFVRKLGFTGYKQYAAFLRGEPAEAAAGPPSEETARIAAFLEKFDRRQVAEVIDALNRHDTIILFGYGPSLYCLQYFTYKLRIVTSKNIIATDDEFTAGRLLKEGTLLLIFSVTGRFKSFEGLSRQARQAGCETLFIIEEYNLDLLKQFDRVLYLTGTFQSSSLKPYEKSRTVFFIFIEEILREMISLGAQASCPPVAPADFCNFF